MPKMISLRTFRLPTLSGHVLQFTANQERDVPEAAVKDAMTAGCAFVDASDTPFYDDMSKAKVGFSDSIKKSTLYLVLKSIAEDNEAKNFDGGGVPKLSVVNDKLGFDVSKREVQDMYQQYLSIKSDGGEFPLHANAPNVLRVVEATTNAELIELGKEFGYEEANLKGRSTRDLRRILFTKLNDAAVG